MATKRFSHLLEYLGVLLFMGTARLLPLSCCYFLATFLGRFWFSVLKLRRKEVLANLRKAFPEKGEAELKKIACQVYKNMVRIMMEFAKFPSLKKRMRERVTIQPREKLDGLLKQGKGVLLVSAHFGSWEVLAAGMALYGYPLVALARDQKNRLTSQVANNLRTAMGTRIVFTNISMRGVLESLKANQVVYLLGDQDAGRKGVFVDFFGYPASTPQGPALFHLKTGAPILIAMAVRNPDSTYTIHLEDLPSLSLTGDKETGIREITQACTAIIEKYIRQYPDQWLWMHRRWKTRPPKD